MRKGGVILLGDFGSKSIPNEKAYEIAIRNGLRYVYIGNVPGHHRNSTFCPSCGRRVIHRTHFDILKMNVANGKCRFCDSPVAGKWV